jgi:DNA-directed RNA polymerase subunit RPC12/RpoP
MLYFSFRQYTMGGMTPAGLRTRWKFVVTFEDEDSGEISAEIGHATTREECEGFIDWEMQYRCSLGLEVLEVEASELCAECEGEGKLLTEAGNVTCRACGGHIGAVAKFRMPIGTPLSAIVEAPISRFAVRTERVTQADEDPAYFLRYARTSM